MRFCFWTWCKQFTVCLEEQFRVWVFGGFITYCYGVFCIIEKDVEYMDSIGFNPNFEVMVQRR